MQLKNKQIYNFSKYFESNPQSKKIIIVLISWRKQLVKKKRESLESRGSVGQSQHSKI